MKLEEENCVPCEGGVPPLQAHEEDELHRYVSNWLLDRTADTHKLRCRFTQDDFVQTMALVNRIASVAEKQGHHPEMLVGYGKLVVEFYTHAICGLSTNDFIMAAKVNLLAQAA
ncbi:MAG: 4a-hydroxytetrahydrobiopterin dehydratase [Chitinivibrionales bacterium]|nr:4a-hydroxytetrahydrobiopterin dehydratase [Chitinivibrionales bacterium]